MATLTLGASFDGLWPPDALAGGVISVRLAGRMTYVSDEGFTITLRGTGLIYDDAGLPAGGTVTGITIQKDGITYATFASITVDFARAGMLLFGFDRDNGFHQNPDPHALFQIALMGNDLITGSAEWDDVRAGIGNDTINTGDGGDYVADESGNDLMDGGDGWDFLSYDEANWSWGSFRGVNLDAATGIALDCWGFTDHFSNFEFFKDSLFADTLKGADIDENFIINRGNDVVNGRGGFDWVEYSDAVRWGATHGVKVDLTTGIARDSWKGTDSLSNVEGVHGSSFNDTLTGNAQHNAIAGDAGIDVMNGGGGIDTLIFWWVGDFNSGHGVSVDLSRTVNVLDDGYGNAETALSFEGVEGSRFDDRLIGSGGDNALFAGDGNDTANGGGGADDVAGGWGNDVLSGGSGNDSIGGGGNDDTITGNTGADNFYFGWDLVDAGIDTITDFEHGVDQILIASWWGGGLVNPDLTASQFRAVAGGTTAVTATQRVIYNTTTGDLYFDVDGAGGVAAVKFAVLSNHATLTFDDIHIML